MSLSSQANAAAGGDLPVLNVAMVGHAFMGRAHSNAWRQCNRFFDLPFRVVPKVIVGRHAERAAAAAHKLGFEHDFKATARRPQSVPYALGELIESLAARPSLTPL